MALIAFLLNLPIFVLSLMFVAASLVANNPSISYTETFICSLYLTTSTLSLFLASYQPPQKDLPIYNVAIFANATIAFHSLSFFSHATTIMIWVVSSALFHIYLFNLLKKRQDNLHFSGNKVRKILIENYNLKPEPVNSINFADDKLLHKIIDESYSEDQIAELYYKALINAGYKNHPDYFNIDIPINDERHLFPPAINKTIFGAYYPDRSDYIKVITLYTFITLNIHQMVELFMPPPVDSFLPSAGWFQASLYINLTLSLFISTSFLRTTKEKTYQLRYKKNNKSIMPFTPIIIFFFLHTAITFSAAEILTEIYGTPAQKTAVSEKHKNKQCVQLNEFQNTLLFKPDVCVLSKEDHKNMGSDPIEMTFTGKESILGFVVKDYELPDKNK